MSAARTITPRICFPARTHCLVLVRHFMRKILQDSKLLAEGHQRVILAVDEAVANIIEHAFCSEEVASSSTIELTVNVKKDQLSVCIVDNGMAFDPSKVPPPTKPIRWKVKRVSGKSKMVPIPGAESSPCFPMRGFGIHLIRLIMDEIRYTRTSEGANVLVLAKHFEKE